MSPTSAAVRPRLEELLRARKLDATLTTALAHNTRRDPSDLIPTGIAALDTQLGGGFARGEVSEIVGPESSGRTSLFLRTLSATTARGERVAVVDALDRLDVSSAVAAGVTLERLLWVRGHVTASPGSGRDANWRALEQSVKAVTLVLQARICDVVVFDIADAPASALRSLPFTTWIRLHRMIEGSRTACILISASPIWRSPAGLTVRMGLDAPGGTTGVPIPSHARLLDGLQTTVLVHRAHVTCHEPVRLPLATVCA